MNKLLSILVFSLFFSGNAYAENEDFIKKHLSNNSLYKQNPKTDFFFGKFKINSSFTKNINFYYAAREETKDGQFYIIEINDNPSIEKGCEDKVLGSNLYSKIMSYFYRRLEAK